MINNLGLHSGKGTVRSKALWCLCGSVTYSTSLGMYFLWCREKLGFYTTFSDNLKLPKLTVFNSTFVIGLNEWPHTKISQVVIHSMTVSYTLFSHALLYLVTLGCSAGTEKQNQGMLVVSVHSIINSGWGSAFTFLFLYMCIMVKEAHFLVIWNSLLPHKSRVRLDDLQRFLPTLTCDSL